jgi:hypothetical protein
LNTQHTHISQIQGDWLLGTSADLITAYLDTLADATVISINLYAVGNAIKIKADIHSFG